MVLDKRTSSILAAIKKLCGLSFKVVEKQEIIDYLPIKLRPSIEVLDKTIDFLFDKDFIDIKYRDEDSYCLVPTAKAIAYVEDNKNVVSQNIALEKRLCFIVAIVAGIAALVGGFIGAIITKLL